MAQLMEVSCWLEQYSKNYACKIKNCKLKKANGRCSLSMNRQETDFNGEPTGKCLDYLKKVGK